MCSAMPPGFSRQAYVMPLLLSFLFFLLLFSDRLEQRDLGNCKCKTDLHQIFRDGRHVRVDVQSGIDFRIGQGTLPWQPILSAKSATRLPSWDSHNESHSGVKFSGSWWELSSHTRLASHTLLSGSHTIVPGSHILLAGSHTFSCNSLRAYVHVLIAL